MIIVHLKDVGVYAILIRGTSMDMLINEAVIHPCLEFLEISNNQYPVIVEKYRNHKQSQPRTCPGNLLLRIRSRLCVTAFPTLYFSIILSAFRFLSTSGSKKML